MFKPPLLYGRYNHSSETAIKNLVDKFESNDSVHNTPSTTLIPPGRLVENINILEENHNRAVGRTLIRGNFNSKSPEWGEARFDRRGILVGEMVARNYLIVLNQGKEFTFRRGTPQGYATGLFSRRQP